MELSLLQTPTELLVPIVPQHAANGDSTASTVPAFLDIITEFAESSVPAEFPESLGPQSTSLYDSPRSKSDFRDDESSASEDDAEDNVLFTPVVVSEMISRKPINLSIPVAALFPSEGQHSSNSAIEPGNMPASDESDPARVKSSGPGGIPEPTAENDQELVFGAEIKKLTSATEEVSCPEFKQSIAHSSNAKQNSLATASAEENSSREAALDTSTFPNANPGSLTPTAENSTDTPSGSTSTNGTQAAHVVADVALPPAETASPTVQDVLIDVRGESDERLRLHVADTDLGIKVAVTGGRAETAEQIRGGLQDLVQALEDRGFAADVWHRDRVAGSEAAAGSDIADEHPREQGDSYPQQQDGRRGSDRQYRPWQDEMEIATGEKVSTWR